MVNPRAAGVLMAKPTSQGMRATKRLTLPGNTAAAGETVSSPLAHDSAVVWCERRQAFAVVSTIERRDSTPAMRYLQWCSLVGLDVDCAEDCRCLERARADRPPTGRRKATS